MTNRILAILVLIALAVFAFRHLLKRRHRQYLHGKVVLAARILTAAALVSALISAYMRFLR